MFFFIHTRLAHLKAGIMCNAQSIEVKLNVISQLIRTKLQTASI